MKYFVKVYFCFLLLMAFIGCSGDTIVPPVTGEDTCGCECIGAILGVDGFRIPAIAHTRQRCSPDGSTLAYLSGDIAGFVLLDLKTLTSRRIQLSEVLADKEIALSPSCSKIIWSPYSSDKFYIHCTAFYDSLGFREYRQNGYIYSISANRAEKVTPKMFGKYGSEEGFGVVGWREGSKEGLDSLHMGIRGVYVPQKDSFYHGGNDDWLLSQSPATDDIVNLIYDQQTLSSTVYLNNIGLNYSKYVDQGVVWEPRWSPSGKKLILQMTSPLPSRNPIDPYTYEEIWILDVVKAKKEKHDWFSFYRLNLQDHFCKYSFAGINPEFITDSTIVVSMHKDGDDFSPLYEITTKGKMVRQLTFKQ